MTATRGASAVQVVPWDMVDLLRPFFDKGPDPVGARLLDLPVLRGAWAASVDSGGDWYDISGHGHTLSYNGNPTFNYDGLVGYWDLDGTGDFFNRADEADLDILGTESYVASAVRGLTCYCWCYPTETGTGEGIFGKWGVAGNKSWTLWLDATDHFNMYFSDDGTNTDNAQSSVVTMNAWYFLCGRVRPSAFVDVFVGSPTGLEETNQATARASIFNSGSDLMVGNQHGGGWEFNGRVAVVALYAAQHSDTQVNVFYHMTKRLFGH